MLQINGPSVKYLGAGDHHEAEFHYLELKTSIHNMVNDNSELGNSYTGMPLNKDFCPFTVRVYPSSLMEADYMTQGPAIITAIVILIFVITSVVFILYDVCVEKRQRQVMNSAIRSDAIVSSLFPSNVRDRLMNHESQQNPQDESVDDIQSSAPIADLFPDAVRFFTSSFFEMET